MAIALTVILALSACGSGGGSGRVGQFFMPPQPPAGVVDSFVSTVTVTPAMGLVANGVDSALITVSLRDGLGSPVANQSVSVSVSGTGILLGTSSGVSDAAGNFTTSLATTRPGSKTISVLVNPGLGQVALQSQPAVSFDPTPAGSPNPVQSTVLATPTSNLRANGTDTSNLTVTVRDINGAVLSGQQVSIAASGGGTLINPVTGTTNASGQVTATLRAQQPGPKTVSVTINPGPSAVLSASMPVVIFNAAPGSPDPSTSTLTVSPSNGVAADGSSTATISATVRDPGGVLLANQTVQLSVNGAATLTPTSGMTNSSGIFTATISSTTVGTKTISAIVNPGASQVTLAQTPTVIFTNPPVPNADQSFISLSRLSGIFADGVDSTMVSVTVRTSGGAAIPNQTVSLSATGGASFSPSSGTSNSSGVFTTVMTSTSAGLKVITAVVNPGASAVTLTNMPSASFDPPPSASASTLSANPTMGILANGTAASTITVTIRNANNQTLANVPVTITASGTGNTLTPASGMTNAMGVFTASLSSTQSGTKTVSATIFSGMPNALAITQTAMVTFDPIAMAGPSPTNSTVTASPTSGIMANGTAASTITVTVRDSMNAALANQTVSISAGAGTTATPASAMTNASGVATFSLTSTQSGPKMVTATVNPGASQVIITAMPTVTFDPVAMSTINGTANDDTLNGTAADDTINGLDGNDTLNGLAGNDMINGGNGIDIIEGGPGADMIDGGPDSDTASYSSSAAGVTVNLLTNTASGGDAAGDTLTNIENLTGSAQIDSLTGNTGDNVLNGLAGNDMLLGGDGNDTLIGGPGADSLNGGPGVDFASYATSAAGVVINLAAGTASGGDAAGDTFLAIEGLIGSPQNDTLTGDNNVNTLIGGAGTDTITGGGGDDIIEGGAGGDTIDGGTGNDTASYASSPAGVTIDLDAATNSGGDADLDSLVSIENLTGSDFNDVLFGDNNTNILMGGVGNDNLAGGVTAGLSGGADVLMGGSGSDILQDLNSGEVMFDGGSGADVLVPFMNTDLSNPNVRMKYSNLEDFAPFNAIVITVNAADVRAIGQPLTINNGMTSTTYNALFIYDLAGAGLPNTVNSTVQGTGWTLLGTAATSRPLSTANTTFEIYENQTATPPAALLVATTIVNRNLTP